MREEREVYIFRQILRRYRQSTAGKAHCSPISVHWRLMYRRL